MMRSLSSAIAGLRAQQTAMDVIGNNIANVNTSGFKSSNTNFTDLFYQTLEQGDETVNPTQVGYGAQVGSIDKNMTSTGATETDNTLDLYIDGDGFFTVNSQSDGSGTTYYTRLGNFHIDAAGNLVDANSGYIMGAQGSGTNVTVSQPINVMGSYFHTTTGKIIKVDSSTYKELSNIKVNKDGTMSASLGDEVGYLSNDVNTSETLNGNVFHPTSGPDVTITGGAGGNTADFSNFTVNSDGTISVTYSNGGSPVTGLLRDNKGNDVNIFGQTFENSVQSAGITAASGNYTGLSNLALQTDGSLTATYNGATVSLVDNTKAPLKLAIATFVNPNGLNEAGNSYYTANLSSGEPSYIGASDGNATVIRSGYLEMSNVDIAKEFTNMITTQRGFQANSRVITVSDSMMEELVNLKRS